MSKIKAQYKFTNLGRALKKLDEVCAKPLDEEKIMIDATIQRFEFTYELFWKILKVLLENEGVEATTPKNVLQEAYKANWIEDEKLWLAMLDDRNITSHVYKEEKAFEIYEHIKNYNKEMQRVYRNLIVKFNYVAA